jgi:crotonobetainyl-CoA:carnitine CoA-transferase CaiB-like acyl-CoA transferase
VYCSITGFGQDGPYAERAGYDLMVQAMCGLMSITGHADGEPGGGPLKVGVAVIDVFTGLYASNAILAALNARDNARNGTGQGQYIDMALLDVGMAVLANQAAGFLATGQAPGRAGNIHPSLAPYQDFPTLDGNVLLAIGNDGQFARFCAAIGQAGWAQDARFATNTARVQNRAALLELMKPRCCSAARPTGLRCWKTRPCPAAPSTPLPRPLKTPGQGARHSAKLAAQRRRRHWAIATVANPMRLSATPVTYRNAPPALGQHTDEVLREFGLDDNAIAALHEQGVV